MTSPGGVLGEADGFGDSDFVDELVWFAREFVFAEGEAGIAVSELAPDEFTTGGFRSAEFLGEAGAELASELAAFAEFEDGDGFVAAREFSVAGEVALELADLDERRIRRGTKMMARRTAAAALTRKSLLERGCGLGEMTRRALPMVALTCGSELTGIGAREGCGVAAREGLGDAFGETGESGTASGSISGSGWRCRATRGRADGDVAEGGSTAATRDSGEPGVSGGRM